MKRLTLSGLALLSVLRPVEVAGIQMQSSNPSSPNKLFSEAQRLAEKAYAKLTSFAKANPVPAAALTYVAARVAPRLAFSVATSPVTIAAAAAGAAHMYQRYTIWAEIDGKVVEELRKGNKNELIDMKSLARKFPAIAADVSAAFTSQLTSQDKSGFEEKLPAILKKHLQIEETDTKSAIGMVKALLIPEKQGENKQVDMVVQDLSELINFVGHVIANLLGVTAPPKEQAGIAVQVAREMLGEEVIKYQNAWTLYRAAQIRNYLKEAEALHNVATALDPQVATVTRSFLVPFSSSAQSTPDPITPEQLRGMRNLVEHLRIPFLSFLSAKTDILAKLDAKSQTAAENKASADTSKKSTWFSFLPDKTKPAADQTGNQPRESQESLNVSGREAFKDSSQAVDFFRTKLGKFVPAKPDASKPYGRWHFLWRMINFDQANNREYLKVAEALQNVERDLAIVKSPPISDNNIHGMKNLVESIRMKSLETIKENVLKVIAEKQKPKTDSK